MGRRAGSIGLETEKRIREEGLRLLAELGYRRTSLRSLGGRVGIWQGGIYNHIRSKDAFLLSVLAENIKALTLKIQEIALSDLDVICKIHRIIEIHLQNTSIDKNIILAIYYEFPIILRNRERHVMYLYCKYRRIVEYVIEGGIKDGTILDMNPRITTILILSIIYGHVLQLYESGGLGQGGLEMRARDLQALIVTLISSRA